MRLLPTNWFAAVLLAVAVAPATAQVQTACSGCNLQLVAHEAGGFWLGPQQIPGVTIQWTPDPNTQDGVCDPGSCDATPCEFGSGMVKVIANIPPVEVWEPGTAALGNTTFRLAKITRPGGNHEDGVGQETVVQMPCSDDSSGYLDIYDIVVWPAPNHQRTIFSLQLRCSACK